MTAVEVQVISLVLMLVSMYATWTWGRVQVRRCECSEAVARIENSDSPPRPAGFLS
jgi:hypothetical protein